MFDKLMKLFLGKELALALGLLRLIEKTVAQLKNPDPQSEAEKDQAVLRITRLVFRQLPEGLKAPQGPMSEQELLTLIRHAVPFALAVRAVVSR